MVATILGLAAAGAIGLGLSGGSQYLFQGEVDWDRARRDGIEAIGFAAISLATASTLSAVGIGIGTIGALSFGLDAAIGTAWDIGYHRDSFERALFNNTVFASVFDGGVSALRTIDTNIRGIDAANARQMDSSTRKST
ncbi:MAG: hypothetical protein AAF846_23490 [Chloroflexota bacterium]